MHASPVLVRGVQLLAILKNTGLGYSAQARLAHLHEVMIVILGNETNSTFVN